MFNEAQQAKLKSVLEAEPCLFNARHKRCYVTMANWLNEVGKKQLATPEDVAAIMVPKGPDRWDPLQGKWIAIEAPPSLTPEEEAAAKVDPWEAQRAALDSALGD